MNNLDSNQRHKEPPEEEKYPKKNLQPHHDAHEEFAHDNCDVNLPSYQISQGGLAQQLNHAMYHQTPMNQASNIPQILVSSQPKHIFGNQPHLGKIEKKSLSLYSIWRFCLSLLIYYLASLIFYL